MASNTLLTVDAITAEALRILHNELAFCANIDKQHDKDTELAGQKRGGSIRIRKPAQYAVRTGWTIDVQDSQEEYDSLTVGTVRGVDMAFSDAELAQDINSFSKQFIRPAVSRLAAEVDLLTYKNCVYDVFHSVGTPGTAPASQDVYLQAGQKLNEFPAPQAERPVIINPAAQAATVGGLVGLFNPSSNISNQYVTGMMSGPALGFSGWYMSQNVSQLTMGTRTGTILVDEDAGTNLVEGTQTLNLDGFGGATQTIAAGEVFTIAGVYAVNRETKESTGQLQQFVVTDAFTASGSQGEVSFSPPIYTSGALQTVSEMPASEDAITFLGTASTAYPQNIAFHKEAFTFATARLEMPSDVNFKSQQEMDGINIRILRQYDINNANYPCRLDVFFGSLAQRPGLACRIWG